jgi:CubicO group peptidase (beta-lactamase class C family)
MTDSAYRPRLGLWAPAFLFLGLWMAFQPALAAAETVREHPDAALGEKVAEVVALINRGDMKEMIGFVGDRYGPGMMGGGMDAGSHARFLMGLHEGKGKLELCCYEISDGIPENMAVATLHGERLDSWSSLQIRFDEADKINSFMIVPTRPPLDFIDVEKLDDAGLARELDAFLTVMAGQDEFSGTVLVARHGKQMFAKAYGLANREHEIPNRLDTRFGLGSMNKMFTAIAVAQLAEQGKLSLDDTIDRYLPEGWLGPEIARKIRVRHLLNHTSGLGDYLEGFIEQAHFKFRALEDYKEIVSKETLQFEPGSQWSYSNTGFLLAGVIVSQASGMDYYDYIRKNIYEPAGMNNTDHYDRTLPDPRIADGYWKDENGDWRRNIFLLSPRGTSAGGGYSTVGDLLAFDMALRSEQLLGKEMRDLLFTRDAQRNSPSYGYGFMIISLAPNREVGHGGTYYGVSAHLSMFLDSGYTLVALSNGPGAQLAYPKAMELIARTR